MRCHLRGHKILRTYPIIETNFHPIPNTLAVVLEKQEYVCHIGLCVRGCVYVFFNRTDERIKLTTRVVRKEKNDAEDPAAVVAAAIAKNKSARASAAGEQGSETDEGSSHEDPR